MNCPKDLVGDQKVSFKDVPEGGIFAINWDNGHGELQIKLSKCNFDGPCCDMETGEVDDYIPPSDSVQYFPNARLELR